jgi:hypothetical protein
MLILPGLVMHVTIRNNVIHFIDCSIHLRYSSRELFILIPHSRFDGPRPHSFCFTYKFLSFRALAIVILHQEVD